MNKQAALWKKVERNYAKMGEDNYDDEVSFGLIRGTFMKFVCLSHNFDAKKKLKYQWELSEKILENF